VKKLILVILLAAIVAAYVFLFRPHVDFKEARASDQVEEIIAVYVGVTGDPLCANLYKLKRMDDGKPVAGKDPLFLALPEGVLSPEAGNLAYSDNVFVLTGYEYKYESKNRITGEIETTPSHRFDVLSWKVVAPYKKWKDSDPTDKTMAEAVTSSEPVAYEFNSADHSPNQFVADNYVDCLAGQ
jgi:hypothetical protein